MGRALAIAAGMLTLAVTSIAFRFYVPGTAVGDGSLRVAAPALAVALTGWIGAGFLRGEGYEVTAAADGQEALELLASGPAFDLILLDMLMPVLDGWHFLEALRRLVPPRSIPILIATGSNLTRQWAEGHGCAGFLRKPIETDALLVEVRRCLGG